MTSYKLNTISPSASDDQKTVDILVPVFALEAVQLTGLIDMVIKHWAKMSETDRAAMVDQLTDLRAVVDSRLTELFKK